MTDKKKKQKNQQISSFFKPIVSSKSGTTQKVALTLSNPVHPTLAPHVKPKALADSTNTPPKKKKAKSVVIPVKPLVFEIESSPAVRRLSPETSNHSLLSVNILITVEIK